ncbi:aspartate--tRNA ligase [Candidatus Woesearchaeota archaeon]|nr:aspartate--tRNA ligase [Candidatus Woesearchaeota archaeon]
MLNTKLRTHTCGELNKSHSGQKVTLCGWADKIRLHGKIGFINLRDRYGITQVFLKDELKKKIETLSRESTVRVTGEVKTRPEPNKELSTGEIEVSAQELEILSEADPLPLEIEEKDVASSDETRLKHRFLDLRKPRLQKNLILRAKVCKALREYLDQHGFLELETPILAKSTPEGARDFLVPSRVYPGTFFALPQSPQLFKQLFMVAGYDRYYQIARCFRDEDLRADRQPEFTQLDIEMSFIDEEDIYHTIEGLMKHVWKTVLNKDLKMPFPRMTYDQAMKDHNSDKPDMRKDKANKDEHAFLWVVDFPLLEWSEDEGRLMAMHHPFTSPKNVNDLKENPEKAKAKAYDLVLNGTELGGGSIRIHRRDVQMEMFKALGIGKEEAEEKFGFLLNAFRYGSVPHGGIAFGLDRMCAILSHEESIREVIAYPKNKDARDLMLDAPSEVNEQQLTDLGLKKR